VAFLRRSRRDGAAHSRTPRGLRAAKDSYACPAEYGHRTELLDQDEIDDKRLVGIQGVVKISHLVLNGTTLLNLDAFAAVSQRLTLTVPMADTL
jgi:hypothetical protein